MRRRWRPLPEALRMKVFALLTQAVLIAVLIAVSAASADDLAVGGDSLERVKREMAALVDDGTVIGAQVAIRKGGQLLFSRGFGVVAADSEKKVGEKTLFLIASCSKPFASACLLSLIADEADAMELDDGIDKWIPAFAKANVSGGVPAKRAPTVEELLSHRSGIYSQKRKLTRAQTRWIRDFRVDLETAVEGISSFPLIAQPGEMYAYSGAGYCVLGRVAELATERTFESILQERICEPLGLTRTTFFPAEKFSDGEIATGFSSGNAPHRLGKEHLLPLIGGSLYTTAEEMTAFGQALLNAWIGEDAEGGLSVSQELTRELGKPRSPQSGYSLGWKVFKRDGKAPILSHSGALHAYRAWLAVDLEGGVSVAACWTLAGPQKQAPVSAILKRVLESQSPSP